MTAISTTWRRLWSAFVDHKLLSEPTGSLYAVKGMTNEQMRQLQNLAVPRKPLTHEISHSVSIGLS